MTSCLNSNSGRDTNSCWLLSSNFVTLCSYLKFSKTKDQLKRDKLGVNLFTEQIQFEIQRQKEVGFLVTNINANRKLSQASLADKAFTS